MAVKQSELAMAVFTDCPKAFDTIDFFTLLQKMHSLMHFLQTFYIGFSIT